LLSKPLECIFPNYTSTLFQKIKIPRPLSQAPASNHPNVFTSTLPLSEWRTCEVWGPSDKIILFLPPPPHNKVSLTFPVIFHFIYSSTLLRTSLIRSGLHTVTTANTNPPLHPVRMEYEERDSCINRECTCETVWCKAKRPV
jgi:hypothetical protein